MSAPISTKNMEEIKTKIKSATITTELVCNELLSNTGMSTELWKYLFHYTKIQMKICNIFSTIPFEWDENKEKIICLRSNMKMTLFKFNVILQWTYTILTAAYFFNTMGLNNMNNKLTGCTFGAVFVVTMFLQMVFWRKQNEGVFLYNCLTKFEDRYLRAAKKTVARRQDKFALFMMLLCICTSFGLPGLLGMMLLVDPCKPPHLSYILFRKTIEICIHPGIKLQIFVLLFDIYIWIIAITSACFYVFQGAFIGVRTLDWYLQLLLGGLKRPLNKIFKTQQRKDEIGFKIYKELRVLSRIYNVIFRPVFFPTLNASALIDIIIGLLAVIKLRQKIPMPGFLFFPLIGFDGLSVLVMVKIASNTLRTSKKLVSEIRKSRNYFRRTWYRKKAVSLELIKIGFGDNFYDELTPLIFLAFCLSQTVSLLLILN